MYAYKRVDLKSSCHKKQKKNMCKRVGMYVNQSYCGDHLTTYTNTESLFCRTEASMMLYFKYVSIKKRKYICLHLKKSLNVSSDCG